MELEVVVMTLKLGGYGILIRKYGLAVDHVIDAHLIDVDGRILDRKSMVVTVFKVNRNLEQNAAKILHRWQYIAHKLPDDIFTDVTITKVNSSQEVKKTIQAAFKVLFLGGVNKLIPLTQDRFPELGLVRENCIEMSWVESILYFRGVSRKRLDILLDRNALPKQYFKAKSDYVKEPIPENGFEGIWSKFFEKEADASFMMMVAFGGKMDAIPETKLPYPHGAGNLLQASYLVGWSKEENAESKKYVSWIRRLYSYMATYVSRSPREAYNIGI
ncbi:hypothetical protein REPUB_Repub07fG0132400 [Reevesia pubescens]